MRARALCGHAEVLRLARLSLGPGQLTETEGLRLHQRWLSTFSIASKMSASVSCCHFGRSGQSAT